MCNAFWEDTDNFIADPDIALIGYQANFKHLKLGYLLFNHNCGTTLSIEVGVKSECL
jgi:hypothetical protein